MSTYTVALNKVISVVTGVGQAVVTDVTERGGGDLQRVCLLVPGSTAWDECDCGQFTQTITSIFPSSSFPTPSNDVDVTPCGPHMLVVAVTLEIVRCIPGVDDNGASPTCAMLLESAIVLEADRLATRVALSCALGELRNEYIIHAYSVGAATSLGPEGNCGGVQITYQFAIGNPCCD